MTWNNDPFLERLQQCDGGPWTLFEAQQHLDALVLQPQTFDASQVDTTLFVDFLANSFHRRLLHCFVGIKSSLSWSLETLLKQIRPPSPQSLMEALECCRLWQIAIENPTTQLWQGHRRLAPFNNLGWTFEWVIQAVLEREYSALVRRHVILGEIMALGEIDILALLPGGRFPLLIECKSSSKGLTDRQLDRFVSKAQGFPGACALLLIDTDDPHHMQQRMGQCGQVMQRAYGDASMGAIQRYGGSSVVQLRDRLFVADTGGGLMTTLQAILEGDHHEERS